MGKQQTIGMPWNEEVLSWCIMRSTGKQASRISSGRMDWPLPPDDAPDPEAAMDKRTGTFTETCKKLKGHLSVGIPTRDVLLRTLRVPTVPDDELADMAELQVDKFSPFPLENMVFSYEVLSRDEETMLILVGGMQKTVADTVGQQFDAAGIRPTRLDVTALAWCRILKEAGYVDDHGRQIAIILGSCTEFILFQDGLPILIRSLPQRDPDHQNENAYHDELLQDIEYSLLSMELGLGAKAIQDVQVWGKLIEAERLAQKLGSAIAAPAHSGNLDELPGLSEGLAQRALDETGFNLIPDEWSTEANEQQFKYKLIRYAALGFLGWFLLVSSLLGVLTVQKNKAARIETRKNDLEQASMSVRSLRRRIRMIGRYINHRDSALEYLREICIVLPPGIDLMSFSYRKGEVVKLSGTGHAVGAVYEFKKRVDASSLFAEATLNGPRIDRRTNKQLFDIVILIKEPGA